MRILVTGKSTKGSWQIRGAQLGAAISADVVPIASNVSGYDCVISVKRVRSEVIAMCRHARVPLIWDVVDAFPQPQPEGNRWSREVLMNWTRNEFTRIRPAAIVVTSAAMANDFSLFKVPVLVLPHHHRPDIKRNPIRFACTTVGYEGAEAWLGSWRAQIEEQCQRRQWRFVMNPEHLADIDIVCCLRDDSYTNAKWKSNVKLANAQGSGTPCVVSRSAANFEYASGGERWCDSAGELVKCFAELSSQPVRIRASEQLYNGRIPIESVADTYKTWLQALKF